MNNLNKLKEYFSKPHTKRVFIALLVVISLLIIFFVPILFAPSTSKPILTVPLITPSASPTTFIPLDTTNPHNPTQKLVFNWGSLNPVLQSKINNYRISTPLVNTNTINFAASKFGFTALEKSPNTDEQSSVWVNNNASVYGSLSLNQLFFNSTSPLSLTNTVITKDQAISMASDLVSDIFGTYLLTTMDPNKDVRFLRMNPLTEDEPQEVTPETANIININFQQTIDNLKLLNLSRKGETISVGLDTSGKVFLMYTHGGYLDLSLHGQSDVISFSKLKEIAPTKAIRISQAEDIDAEAVFTAARTVTVNVSQVSLGYFQRTDNSLFPVYIVEGNMSAPRANPFPAVYIIPATEP